MISGLVWLVMVVAVLALVYWFLTKLPLPPVVSTFLQFVLAIIGIVLLGKILMGIVGAPPGF